MKNWSVDTSAFNKKTAEFRLWKTEQMINFGTDGASLNRSYIKEHFHELSIDPKKKQYLSFLLWGKISSRPPKRNS